MVKLYTEPHYAVIFTSLLDESQIDQEYQHYNDLLEEEAKKYDGYLGMDSARNGLGISVSYWIDTDSIVLWRQNFEHKIAIEKGISKWYKSYNVRVAKVERSYEKQLTISN
jgi:heme-degrading monooxygenase HmoA